MPLRKLRVLIVDDNQGVQILLRVLLNSQNCNVMQASNVDEARSILLTQPQIDLIISDLKMPGEDGFSFLAWRDSDPHFSKIPIILLSGDVALEHIARQHNIEFYLEKGGHPSELIEMIKSVMQKRGYSFPVTA